MAETTAPAVDPAAETATGEQAEDVTGLKSALEKEREARKAAEKDAKRAKELETRVQQFEQAQMTEAEKVADRIAKAEAEVAAVPAKVAASLREHLVALHEINSDDAELFLTASEPDLLLKQVTRLLERSAEQSAERKKNGNVSPREGNNPTPGQGSDELQFARELFSNTG